MVAAPRGCTEVYDRRARGPARPAAPLEPAEVFHEILEHRWFLSEQAGHEIDTMEAARSYVDDVLSAKPDEKLALPCWTFPEAD